MGRRQTRPHACSSSRRPAPRRHRCTAGLSDPAWSLQGSLVGHKLVVDGEAEPLVDADRTGRIGGVDSERRIGLARLGTGHERLSDQRTREPSLAPRSPRTYLTDVLAAVDAVVGEYVRRYLVAIERDARQVGTEVLGADGPDDPSLVRAPLESPVVAERLHVRVVERSRHSLGVRHRRDPVGQLDSGSRAVQRYDHVEEVPHRLEASALEESDRWRVVRARTGLDVPPAVRRELGVDVPDSVELPRHEVTADPPTLRIGVYAGIDARALATLRWG